MSKAARTSVAEHTRRDDAILAGHVVDLVGGPENIRSVIHCQTRLRFDLRDESLVRQKELRAIDGVISTMSSGGMYQVVIGMHVKDVYDEVQSVLRYAGSDAATEEKRKKQNPVATVIDFISGTFIPVIPAIAGAGMVRAVLSLLVVFGVTTRESQTYVVLNFFADAVFYFLPILLAISAAHKLKSNPYVAAGVAGIMLSPTWVGLVAAGEPVRLFESIPLTFASYSYTVIPILLVMVVQAPFERWLNKVMPKSINLVFVPLVVFLVMGTLAMTVIGPLGAVLGGYLADFFTFLSTSAAWAPALLIGALWPIMVMFGVHTAVGPLGLAQMNVMQYDSIVGPGIIVSNIAQGVAALTVAFRTKDLKLKQIASAGGVTGLMGITEPALYGVNLPKRYPLIAAVVGGAAGGLYAGLTQVRRFAVGVSGLPALPMYIGEDTLSYLYNILIALAISIVVTIVVTIALAPWFEKRLAAAIETEDAAPETTAPDATEPVLAAAGTTATLTRTGLTEITAPCTGTVIPLSDVQDKIFASGAMGPGVGVEPAAGTIVAPCAGEVVVAMETGHAFGIRTDSGVEILVHVGVDTVEMNGLGFSGAVRAGTRVEAGQRLVTADLGAIEAAGHPTTVVMVVTNHAKVGEVSIPTYGTVVAGEPVLTVQV